MTLIDLAQADAVQGIMAAPRFVSGGSVANTAVGLAELGGRAGFVGAVADDEVGHTYVENLRAAGVAFEPVYGNSPGGDALGTGRCIVLISDDAERTMGTYLGAASTLTVAGVSAPFVERAAIVLLEGYLWDVAAAKEAMRHAAAIAHEADGSVALSLSDPFCVDRHQREFLDLLVDDIDILLGNEEEITMLFGAASHHGGARGGGGDRPARRHDAWGRGLRRADRARPRGGGGGAGRTGGRHHRRRRSLRRRHALRADARHGPRATARGSVASARPR